MVRGRGAEVDFELDTSGSRRQVNLLSKKLHDSRDEVRKLKAAVNQLGRELKKAMEDGKRGADSMSGWSSAAGKLATTYLSLEAGIGAVRAVHSRMIEEAERGLERLQASVDPFRAIRQISGSTQEFQANRKRIRDIAVKEGRTEEDIARVFFSAASAGALDQFEAIIEGSRFLNDPEAGATAVGTFRSAQSFGAEEAGTGRQILSKLGRAGAASKFTVDDLIRGSILTSAPAKSTNSTDEELLAILSSTSFSFANIERAATAINAVQNVLASGIEVGQGDKKEQVRFTSQGTVAGFQRLRQEFPEQFQELLDSNIRFKEGASAIGAALDSGVLQKRQAEIDAENRTLAFLRTQGQIFSEDSETQAAVAVSGSEEARKQSEARRAQGNAAARVASNQARTAINDSDELSGYTKSAANIAIAAGEFIGVSPDTATAATVGLFDGGASTRVVEEQMKQTALLQRMADRADSQVGLSSDNGPGNQ